MRKCRRTGVREREGSAKLGLILMRKATNHFTCRPIGRTESHGRLRLFVHLNGWMGCIAALPALPRDVAVWPASKGVPCVRLAPNTQPKEP